MKLLIVDNASIQASTRSVLLQTERNHNVDVASSFESLQSMYAKEKYDVVIIDFSLPYGEASLDYITQSNPLQKIVTVSESAEYSEKHGCEYCVEHNRRRRLVNPSFAELYVQIENFEFDTCLYYNPEANPDR